MYTPGKPITYDEERAIITKERRGGYVPYSLIKVPDLYGIEYSGDDHTLQVSGNHPSSTMGSNKNVHSTGSNNKPNIKVRTDQHVLVGDKPRVPIMRERTSTNNDGSTSVLNGTYISNKVQSGEVNCNSSSVDDGNLATSPSDVWKSLSTEGKGYWKKIPLDDRTRIVELIDPTISPSDVWKSLSMKGKGYWRKIPMDDRKRIVELLVYFNDKNVSNTECQPTAADNTLNSSTDDPEVAYLNKILRKETKRITRSIARHITGSSREYQRAVSICNPSVIVIQRYVRRYLVNKSFVTNRKKVNHGTPGRRLNISRMDDSTMKDGGNSNRHVITRPLSPSSTTTTDITTTDSHVFNQLQESTTPSIITSIEGTPTSSSMNPWGALLSDILSSNTTSAQYQDAFEYTATKESEEQCGVQLDMYVHPTGNKLGECTLCTFLVKDWQWIDIMARKYGTRAFWYGRSSDGYQDGTFDGYLISSRSTTESRPEDFVMLSLVCFFLDGYAFSEASDALHKVLRHQGRWGEVKSTSHEEKWGARVLSNEHESPLLGNEFNECFALIWTSRATATFARIFDRDLRALETLQLQRVVLDPLSHLRTWIFICHVTFDYCELVLLRLKIRLTKSGNLSHTSSSVHNFLRYSKTITGGVDILHIQACGVNNNQPICYSSGLNCNNCQRQIATATQADSWIGHIKWEELRHLRIGSKNDISFANNNTRIDGESDDGNGEQMLLKYEEPTDNERRNDVSTPTSDVCIIYSSTREHRIILTTQYCIKSISDTDSDEIKLSPTISNSERRVQNDAETGIILHVSSDVPIHDIRFRVDKPVSTSTQHIMHRGYGEHSIAHVTNSNKDIGSTNNTTSQDGEHVISMSYAVSDNTPTSYGQYDLDILMRLVVIVDYNTHWLITCIDGEQAAMPIDTKYTTIKYTWIRIILIRVMKGYGTSTSSRNGNTWYSSIVNHVMTNTHTDGIVDNNIAHRNQVLRSNIIRGSTLSVRIRGDTSAMDYVLNLKIDNAYKLLRGEKAHDNNTRTECDTAQLVVEFENVTMHNISPTRWDGRGVSAGRFKGQYLNTHPIWMNWKGTYDLVGIKPMTP
jgi:hypothetical protein